MRKPFLLLPVALSLPALLPAQTLRTLLLPQAQDADSLDQTSRSLSKIHRLDIAAVTPATGATMFSALPIAAISALVGDPDGDGIIAEFWKDNSALAWSHSGCLVRNRDKGMRDPRRIYWSVRDNGATQNPVFLVFTNGGTRTHKVRPGDFARIGENGNAAFFITQELVMKAAGPQSGQHAKGALCMCQAKDGSIYYSPPNGGHDVSNGTKRVRAAEGAIVWIPPAAITYAASGDVKDVRAGSARLVAERGTNRPSINPNAVAMVTNSAATDVSGNLVATTLTNWLTNMTGLAIDPNGGTWTSRLTGSVQHPNLIFAFDNWVYRGTIFSTVKRKGSLGSIAVINGVKMGVNFGKATGAWLGAKGQNRSPTIHGLEVVGWGLKPNLPYGIPVLDTVQAGAIDTRNDATFALDFQGLQPLRPLILTLGFEPARGRPLLAINLSSLFAGFSTIYTFTGGPLVGGQGITGIRGRKFLRVPNPKDPKLLGLGLIWQGLILARTGRHVLTNPVVTEFR